jgi:hypothetical protein
MPRKSCKPRKFPVPDAGKGQAIEIAEPNNFLQNSLIFPVNSLFLANA